MDIIGSLLRCHPVFDHIFGCPQPWRPAWRRSAWPQRLRFFVASKIWGSNPVVVTASKLRTWRFHNFDSDILRSCSLHWFCFTRAHYIDFRLGDWVLSESFSSDVEDVPGTWGPKLPQGWCRWILSPFWFLLRCEIMWNHSTILNIHFNPIPKLRNPLA